MDRHGGHRGGRARRSAVVGALPPLPLPAGAHVRREGALRHALEVRGARRGPDGGLRVVAAPHALTDPGRPAGPCAIVIFGASGDLTKRKLIPALYNLKTNGLLPKELAVVGVARSVMTHAQFRDEQSRDIRQFATSPVDEPL